MRLLTFLFGMFVLVGVAWLFYMFTYPLARRLGIIKGDKDADSIKHVSNGRDSDGMRMRDGGHGTPRDKD